MVLTPTLALLLLGFTLAQSYPMKAFLNESSEETDNIFEKDYFTVSAIIERANKNVGQILDKYLVISGDIATYPGFQNADPCTSHKCRWHRYSDGKVYVPYKIDNDYTTAERNIIENALRSFQQTTCIVFRPWRHERDYIHIQSLNGCYSFVGRQDGGQVLSLERSGCVYHKVVQHELLHALGFHHEHERSDRDKHVKIIFRNIQRGKESNFDKVNTNNLDTPYDYGSIMHYRRNSFSKSPLESTIIPIPDGNAQIGYAQEMSRLDIQRVNKLYCT